MLKYILLLIVLMPFPVCARQEPPVCREPYMYVQSYGTWELKQGVWHLPFQCDTGLRSVVSIAEENVANLGLAEYYITAEGFDNNNTFFFVEPCGAMGLFCQYVRFPPEAGLGQIYSLE